MIDYLLNTGNPETFADRPLPVYHGVMAVSAYSDLGTPATTDEAGNVLDPGTAPTVLDGAWFIYMADELPADLRSFAVAEWAREDGYVLPDGVAGLSTVQAGMFPR